MQGRITRFGFYVLLIFGLTDASAAEAPVAWTDDALLHDIQWVGSRHAFAVGEHGTIWKSDDGGRKWSRLNCGLDVSLRSVCFLTDQDGWIAGCDPSPYSAADGGLLLATHDGGRTWKPLGKDKLPALSYVKFFDLEEGIVVGQSTPHSPTGIYKTKDGGATWTGVTGNVTQSWKACSFVQSELGAVAGANGRVSLMGGERLYDSNLPARGLRTVRAIGLTPDQIGWLAGDGGLVLKTSKGGVTWEVPPSPLPDELRNGMDFRAVEIRDEKVWLAGSPGSVIWHSPDGGESWARQSTGQSAPISTVRFANDQLGIAVGAFGVINRTEDGGKTWQAVRGAGRRAALLSLHARPGQTSAALLTRLSGEMGYRSAVWIAQRTDQGPLANGTGDELNLQAAVQKCGGNAADIHWQLPQTTPGAEYSRSKLAEEWQKQTEGRLQQTFVGHLVRQIRTWRPSVIVIDQPSADDAACQMLHDELMRATEQAADANKYVEQLQTTGLTAWKVDRIYLRLAPGATGSVAIDLDEFLPLLKTSTRIASNPAMALLSVNRRMRSDSAETSRIGYRRAGLNGNSQDKSGPGGGDFFSGLSIDPGSDARRTLAKLDESNLERMQKLVQKQRNFSALAAKSLDSPRIAGQMLGQINQVVDGMEPAQVVSLLSDLADEYRKRSQFEMVEATYLELIRRCPNEPGSIDAMRWLIQFSCSNETAWQRVQAMSTGTTISLTRSDQPAQFVQQAIGGNILADDGTRQAVVTPETEQVEAVDSVRSPTRLNVKLDLDSKPDAKKKNAKSTRMTVSRDTDWRTGAVSEWHGRAISVSHQLEALSPNLYRSREIQFPLASLKRSKGAPRNADAIMRGFVQQPVDVETKELAERELWTSLETEEAPSALARCQRTPIRPQLDGLLSDPCWESAKEIILTSRPVASARTDSPTDLPQSLVMFSYDAEFLYVAISVPRAPGAPRDGASMEGRKHDADLSRHDRVTIRLDVDRDYATWYEFQIDQRGWTAESCWEDQRWNPDWYVAAASDATDWRIEAAIPWKALAPQSPQEGTFYAVSILRTIPTVGLQSWTHPATTQVRPSSFGLLKFD